jgi:ferredoxin
MRIIVDRERCIGAAQCVLSAPDVFDQSESDGRVLLRVELPASGAPEGARTAVALCPSGALSLGED